MDAASRNIFTALAPGRCTHMFFAGRPYLVQRAENGALAAYVYSAGPAGVGRWHRVAYGLPGRLQGLYDAWLRQNGARRPDRDEANGYDELFDDQLRETSLRLSGGRPQGSRPRSLTQLRGRTVFPEQGMPVVGGSADPQTGHLRYLRRPPDPPCYDAGALRLWQSAG